MKLIPLSDFVLEQKKRIEKSGWQSTVENSLEIIFNYTNFLKQPLTLGMFVPVDEEGNVLKETPPFQFYGEHTSDTVKRVWGYKEAKEKVLFEGFEVGKFGFKDQYYVKLGSNENSIYPFPNVRNYVVEDLVDLGIELTPSALEAIGIK